jgi:hypothetical protein
MLDTVIRAFLRPGGPYLYLRLVTAAYAVSAIGRLIPVKRKQVPGYRRRAPATVWALESARHRSRRRTPLSTAATPGSRRLVRDPARV